MAKCVKKLHFYKLIFAYDGSRFAGSAKQPGGGTVQDALDAALKRLGAVEFSGLSGAGAAGVAGVAGGGGEKSGFSLGAGGDGVLGAGAAGVAGGGCEKSGFSLGAGGGGAGGLTQLASRTDKGVHALTNVAKAAFGYAVDLPYAVGKINAECPGLWLRAMRPCGADFEPRFAARGRSYRYIFRLQNSAQKQIFCDVPERQNLCDLPPKDLAKMRVDCAANTPDRAGEFGAKNAAFCKAYFAALPSDFCLASFVLGARELLGEHDFCQLCLAAAEQRSTRRSVRSVRVYRHGDALVFNIFSTGFLRGQIRLILGALLALAAGKITHEQWLEQLSGARAHSRISAPAAGLYLKSIYY